MGNQRSKHDAKVLTHVLRRCRMSVSVSVIRLDAATSHHTASASRTSCIVGLGALAISLHAANDSGATYTTRTLALPDHGKGNITMDYIAYDSKTGYVWVPAINIGSVDIVNTTDGSVRSGPQRNIGRRRIGLYRRPSRL